MGLYLGNTQINNVKVVKAEYEVIPSGTLSITSNGIYDCKKYASASVNVDDGHELITNFIEGPLTSITSTASKIDYGTFAYRSQLTTASFPNCTSIGSYAFYWCPSLVNISFPNCSNIGGYAFTLCYSLATVSFPNCSNIGSQTFNYCYRLTTASFPNCTSIGVYAFYSCHSLVNISFPNCTSIGGYAFALCYSLATVSFPNCSNIGNSAFRVCYKLTSLYLTGSSLCSLGNSNAFSSTPIAGYTTSTGGVYGSIFVPQSLLTTYQNATNWTYFSSRFVGI